MPDIYDDDEFVALRKLVPHAKIGCLLCHDNKCTNHFETFTTSIKNNRQSCWIKTITIFTMDMDGKKRSSTYPLTLAMKGKNHDTVEQYYMRQIISLKEGKLINMYSRSHKAIVNVHAEIFCILNDQPER
jgi:hypothetical protein